MPQVSNSDIPFNGGSAAGQRRRSAPSARSSSVSVNRGQPLHRTPSAAAAVRPHVYSGPARQSNSPGTGTPFSFFRSPVSVIALFLVLAIAVSLIERSKKTNEAGAVPKTTAVPAVQQSKAVNPAVQPAVTQQLAAPPKPAVAAIRVPAQQPKPVQTAAPKAESKIGPVQPRQITEMAESKPLKPAAPKAMTKRVRVKRESPGLFSRIMNGARSVVDSVGSVVSSTAKSIVGSKPKPRRQAAAKTSKQGQRKASAAKGTRQPQPAAAPATAQTTHAQTAAVSEFSGSFKKGTWNE